jgi:8-oxo-dGTP pyrophosphatase MutT (NUDIX family)
MHPFAEHLKYRLTETLPGFEAQKNMAPVFEHGSYRSFQSPPTAKHSAVLLLLHPEESQKDDISVLLTLRASSLNHHKGQWSLPGGRSEQGETYIETALRETNEEVGISHSQIQILGELSELYTPPSNSAIHPIVGWCGNLPSLVLSQEEVDIAQSVAIDYLADRNNIRWETRRYNDLTMNTPQWSFHPTVPLWGATAIILAEMLSLYNEWKNSY